MMPSYPITVMLKALQSAGPAYQDRRPDPILYHLALARDRQSIREDFPSQYPAQYDDLLTPRSRNFFSSQWSEYVASTHSWSQLRARDQACRAVAVRPHQAPYATCHFDQQLCREAQTAGVVETHTLHPRIMVAHSDGKAIVSPQSSPALQNGLYSTVQVAPHKATIDYCGGSYATYQMAQSFCQGYRMGAQQVARSMLSVTSDLRPLP